MAKKKAATKNEEVNEEVVVPKAPPLTAKELQRAWALAPFLLDELFRRAEQGNKVALSIIASADANMKHARVMAYLRTII